MTRNGRGRSRRRWNPAAWCRTGRVDVVVVDDGDGDVEVVTRAARSGAAFGRAVAVLQAGAARHATASIVTDRRRPMSARSY
jgi:hypothetical protein